jgi:hypothetical protein
MYTFTHTYTHALCKTQLRRDKVLRHTHHTYTWNVEQRG